MEEFAALCWVLRATALAAVMWLVYIIDRIAKEGVFGMMKNPQDFKSQPALWAQRAQLAHSNAIENLVVMAVAVIIAHLVIPGNETVVSASMIYFFARLVHFVSYTAGIFGLRSVSFIAGFVCQLVVIYQVANAVIGGS